MNKKGWINRLFGQEAPNQEQIPGQPPDRDEEGGGAWQPGWILRPGQVLIDNFKVIEMVGSPGGMGQVFSAEDLRLGLKVAIKVPALNVLSAPKGAGLFLEEARKAARLRPHPHIVLINACLTDPKLKISAGDNRDKVEIPFIVMEFLGGGDLSNRLKKDGQLAFDLASDWFTKMCSAVHYAHTFEYRRGDNVLHGIVHRDLKPQNICFDENGRLVVVDFGLARVLEDPSTSGGAKGTPTHMAPEQWSPSRGIDQRTDIYALGVILFEMVTGRLPFMGETLEELIGAHLTELPPDPRQYRPDLPNEVAEAVLKAMEKEKNDRFESVKQLAQAVAEGFKKDQKVLAENEFEKPVPERKVDRQSVEACSFCEQQGRPDIIGGRPYCSNCGQPWTPSARPTDQSSNKVELQSVGICSFCDQQGQPDVTGGKPYCSNCGQPWTPSVQSSSQSSSGQNSEFTCPFCGSTNPPIFISTGKYCSDCGGRIL